MSKFLDRYQAGQLLAEQLAFLTENRRGVVLALPRGGVPVGYEIARRLHWPLDVWLVRKLGVPDQPELAMGAISSPRVQLLNRELIQRLGISAEQIETVTRAEYREMDRRDRLYRQNKRPHDLNGIPIVVVDDGLATGATMVAAVTALRQQNPASLTVAVPVAATSSLPPIRKQADHIVCLQTSNMLGSISQWYEHFEPVEDQTVVSLLAATTDSDPPVA